MSVTPFQVHVDLEALSRVLRKVGLEEVVAQAGNPEYYGYAYDLVSIPKEDTKQILGILTHHTQTHGKPRKFAVAKPNLLILR